MGRMIRLGAVCFSELEGDYPDFLDLCGKFRLDIVELKHEPPLSQREGSLRTDLISQKAQKAQIELAVHTRFQGLNIASLDDEEWRRSIEEVENSLKFARDIGARWATVHAGDLPTVQYSPENLRESWQRSARALRRLTAFADDMGVGICIENGNGFAHSKIRHSVVPAHLVDELDPASIKLCHLHDNNGEKDEHRSVGSSALRVERLFRRYAEEGWNFPLNIEVKSLPDLAASVEYANRILSTLELIPCQR